LKISESIELYNASERCLEAGIRCFKYYEPYRAYCGRTEPWVPDESSK